MEERVPKEKWPPGPWHDEPDELSWIDEETGYKCLIRRGFFGSLCGYVGLHEGHKLYGKKYNYRFPIDDLGESPCDMDKNGPINLLLEALYRGFKGADGCCQLCAVINVHGGLTFTDMWEQQNDGLWYLGFDCGHCNDYQPGLDASLSQHSFHNPNLFHGSTYRDLEYVKNECRRLASQLKAIEGGGNPHGDPEAPE